MMSNIPNYLLIFIFNKLLNSGLNYLVVLNKLKLLSKECNAKILPNLFIRKLKFSEFAHSTSILKYLYRLNISYNIDILLYEKFEEIHNSEFIHKEMVENVSFSFGKVVKFALNIFQNLKTVNYTLFGDSETNLNTRIKTIDIGGLAERGVETILSYYGDNKEDVLEFNQVLKDNWNQIFLGNVLVMIPKDCHLVKNLHLKKLNISRCVIELGTLYTLLDALDSLQEFSLDMINFDQYENVIERIKNSKFYQQTLTSLSLFPIVKTEGKLESVISLINSSTLLTTFQFITNRMDLRNPKGLLITNNNITNYSFQVTIPLYFEYNILNHFSEVSSNSVKTLKLCENLFSGTTNNLSQFTKLSTFTYVIPRESDCPYITLNELIELKLPKLNTITIDQNRGYLTIFPKIPKLKSNPYIQTFSIPDIEQTCFIKLVTLNKSVTSLNINRISNRVDNDISIDLILESIKTNSTLTYLRINQFSSVMVIKIHDIFDILEVNHTLAIFYFPYYNIKGLNLNVNLERIENILKSNSTLIYLDIDRSFVSILQLLDKYLIKYN
ncbi:hypothetical protein DLAC_09688 [Tieghemostelium lacteum]|uniref:Uncharacterized protein n=1 Tax=Tieghemostelium lacteum TaxID=361077 RepID=A0A151Z6Y0_TIELA|nr:hypothetical protein DLAC_09688 [Tieghemostelium lacteum]|eukprot:KYQ89720.1 hypothetical protein DLAC_09688 [Tieghemostelium lacteum]